MPICYRAAQELRVASLSQRHESSQASDRYFKDQWCFFPFTVPCLSCQVPRTFRPSRILSVPPTPNVSSAFGPGNKKQVNTSSEPGKTLFIHAELDLAEGLPHVQYDYARCITDKPLRAIGGGKMPRSSPRIQINETTGAHSAVPDSPAQASPYRTALESDFW